MIALATRAASRRLAPGGWLYETLAILASGFLASVRSLLEARRLLHASLAILASAHLATVRSLA
jgi:hypothetical protein